MSLLPERRKTGFTSLLLLAPFLALSFSTPTSKAQTGEITNRVVAEESGIDIRHRGEQGRVISGVVSGAAGADTAPAVWVTLYTWPSGTGAASSFIQAGVGRGFSFQGLP